MTRLPAAAATAAQADAVAGLQRANAELQARLDAALARHGGDYEERAAHQAATIDVLKAMAASPGDPQPVFDLITRQAQKLCNGVTVPLCVFDGELVHLRSITFDEKAGLADRFEAWRRTFPMVPVRESILCRAIIERAIINIPNIAAAEGVTAFVRALGSEGAVALPLMRDGAAIGSIGLNSRTPGGVTDSQIELLKTFAEQAVIAIGSAETYRALQTRTSELQESLEYQTATSDVLKVMSRSTFDLQPVLETVVRQAVQLCDADFGAIDLRDGDVLRVRAAFSDRPEFHALMQGLVLPIDRGSMAGRAVVERRIVKFDDVFLDPDFTLHSAQQAGMGRSGLGVPLFRDGEVVGAMTIVRKRVEPFTQRQIELVSTFADQAVIAIENTRLVTEQQEALEQQTATTEVLQVINASPGNLTPVFDAMLEKATRLCDAPSGFLWTFDGKRYQGAATRGVPPAFVEFLNESRVPGPGTAIARLAGGEPLVHFHDLMAADSYRAGDPLHRTSVDIAGFRTVLIVPLQKDGKLLGGFSVNRQEVRPFTDKQIALVRSFAAQAVIAMESARLIDEQREALEQQTATAEVLQVINASPGELAPVFDALLEKAMRVCGAAFGELLTHDGGLLHTAAIRGVPAPFAEIRARHNPLKPFPGAPLAELLRTKRPQHTVDLMREGGYQRGNPGLRAMVDVGGARTVLVVPLLKDETVMGGIAIYRQEVRAFTPKQVALLENFAAQAVIAMESARLLHELRARTDELAQRQDELRVTFENMGDGVAMFDETPRLVAWNRKFQDILEMPDGVLEQRPAFPDYIHYLARRGEFGAEADPDIEFRRVMDRSGEHYVLERTRPDGRIIEIRHNPVAGGGFVLIYADITERKRNEAEISAARDAAEEASRTIEAAFRELKTAQANLIQAEKMASLGQLTAGIAHEIKNPLNFVNNFAELSVDLLVELKDAIEPSEAALNTGQRHEVADVMTTLTSNLEKIVEHGKRADGIVKAMLEHSRGASGERRMVDINTLVDEALNLAYHGARAQDQRFNITLERDFGDGIAPIEVNPQDLTRVFLNVFSNGFHAANLRARDDPTLKVITRDLGEAVEIRVRDNGIGIPDDIKDKLFQPFFTTKPSGEGTGLGLSITYDIVTKAHGGTIEVESEVGAFTEFVITLPRQMFVSD